MLKVTVVHAKLTKDVESFGKQDPYVKITYMGTPYKTVVHQNGGKSPVWNQTFDIRIGGMGDELLLEVKDEDVVGAKFIGHATIKASALCINGGVREYFTITEKKGGSVGQVMLDTKFTADGATQKPAGATVVQPQMAYAMP
jgi:Ca2+-dependent lipid-binding protein